VGITIITAALIILLSAFNGIEEMIERLYSEFDTDITVRVKKGKHFNESRIDLEKVYKVEGVAEISRAIEEVIILKHEEKWVHANMYGIDSNFMQITHMDEHVVDEDGEAYLKRNDQYFSMVGASLLEKLNAYVTTDDMQETLICYVPKKKLKIRPGRSPFSSRVIPVAGRVNYNREVNSSSYIVPIELSKEMLGLENKISALYIDGKPGINNDELKEALKEVIGDDFNIKTNFEKNELIFKTSKSEKIIVLIILLFIFILAAFNLVASLTMLFVEKRDNVATLHSMGAQRKTLFQIFFIEGLLISGKGVFFGFIIGYAICASQIYFGFLEMPNTGGEAFPISISIGDGLLIFTLVAALSVLFSYLPVKYLIKKNL